MEKGEGCSDFHRGTDLSTLRCCASRYCRLPLAPISVNLAVFKSTATPLLSPPSTSPLGEPRSARAVRTPPALLRQAASSEPISFHFRQASTAAIQPGQICGAQLLYSRAPPPQTSERRTNSAACATPAPDEQRLSNITQPILSSFSLCFLAQRAQPECIRSAA